MSRFFLCLLIGGFSFIRGAEIENARAIVTGAANGIGYACAYDLLSNNAQAVAILDIDVVNGTVATEKLNSQFGENRAYFFATDVADSVQFKMNFLVAVQTLGGLDIITNDAGIMDDTKWRRMIDINIKGEVQGTLMSLDVMGKHKGGNGGTIVNIASTASFIPFEYVPIYGATKHAIIGLSENIALSYNKTGVAVKSMCPGATNTLLHTSKAHRFLDFIDYDEAIEFLADFPLQESSAVSKEVIRLIEEAPNGAIWVVEPNEPVLSLDIPDYREWGTPV